LVSRWTTSEFSLLKGQNFDRARLEQRILKAIIPGSDFDDLEGSQLWTLIAFLATFGASVVLRTYAENDDAGGGMVV
jgi:hypothetical protein